MKPQQFLHRQECENANSFSSVTNHAIWEEYIYGMCKACRRYTYSDYLLKFSTGHSVEIILREGLSGISF